MHLFLVECTGFSPKVGADKDQWHGDAEPEEAQRKQGAKGHGARGLLAPDEHVEGEEDQEAAAWE